MSPGDEQAGREAGGRGVRAAPRWFAAAVLALGLFAALALVGRPAGLGLSVLCAGLFAAAAIAAGRRDPWTAAWWLLAAALAPLARSPLGAGPRRVGPALRGGALAALLLAVFVPLFASADAAFAEILGRAVPSDLPFDRPAARVLALLGVATAGGALALVARHGPVRTARVPRVGLARLEWLLRALLAALCLLCVVVLASALERLGLYEQAFGFTRLRLIAHTQILWLGAVLVLVLSAVPAGRTAWLPRAVVAVSAAGALAFALSDPDGRIAQHNVDRFERSGRIDLAYLAGLSPDAAPALARLPADRAACATAAIRRTLAAPDGLAGANLGRARARRALAGVPRPGADCSAR